MQSDWSAAEKKIARRVFDAALHRELAEVMEAFKSMAQNATEPDDMWSTEEFLTKSRNSIDRKYDYRFHNLNSYLAACSVREEFLRKIFLAYPKKSCSALFASVRHEDFKPVARRSGMCSCPMPLPIPHVITSTGRVGQEIPDRPTSWRGLRLPASTHLIFRYAARIHPRQAETAAIRPRARKILGA